MPDFVTVGYDLLVGGVAGVVFFRYFFTQGFYCFVDFLVFVSTSGGGGGVGSGNCSGEEVSFEECEVGVLGGKDGFASLDVGG